MILIASFFQVEAFPLLATLSISQTFFLLDLRFCNDLAIFDLIFLFNSNLLKSTNYSLAFKILCIKLFYSEILMVLLTTN